MIRKKVVKNASQDNKWDFLQQERERDREEREREGGGVNINIWYFPGFLNNSDIFSDMQISKSLKGKENVWRVGILKNMQYVQYAYI